GIQSAIGIPVQIGGQIVGVIELFAVEPRAPDSELLHAAAALGSQVGQFIERKRTENALRESEDRFRAMADSAPVLLWVAGVDGLRDWHNSGWLEFTGRTMEEELGNGWAEGLHPADFNTALDTYLTAFNAQAPFEMEYRLRRFDGDFCWMLERAAPRFESGRAFAGYIGSCIDISDRKRHEEEQTFLAEATRVLASSLDYRVMLTSVAQLAVPTVADWCVIHAVDADGGIGQLAVAHADPAKVAWALEIQERYPPDLDAPTGIPRVIRTGQPEVYPHIPEEMIAAAARDEEHFRLLRDVGFTSAMLVPIVARDRVLGVVSFVSAELGRRYGAADLALAQHLADRAAVSIDNALL
ncbi:MAG: GAF domain-containing protein, partial [Vicinamibacterales bacterium]